MVLKSIKCFESHSTQQNIIFEQYLLPVEYLLKMGRMDKEQALFEQITLSDFKKWSTTALQTLSQF